MDCSCYRCTEEAVKADPRQDGFGGQDARMMRMFICASCGNKRCPHAADHRNACTGSNEPGQPGSRYPRMTDESPARAVVEQLLPCPLCSSDKVEDDLYIRDGRKVACISCGCSVHACHPVANIKARNAWNTRPATPQASAGEVEALSAVLEHFDGKRRDKDWFETERLVRAALSASSRHAVGVAIKPLVWQEPHPSHKYPNWHAMQPAVRFHARIDTSRAAMWGKFPLAIDGSMVDQKFDTVEAAKAFAEARYRDLVSSLLTPAPERTEPVEGVERARFEAHYKHLDFSRSLDAWGNPKYTHSHVGALWEGWSARSDLETAADAERRRIYLWLQETDFDDAALSRAQMVFAERIWRGDHMAALTLPANAGADVETGWLIEHEDEPKWLTLRPGEAVTDVCWTKESLEALRFCRRSDAEDYVSAHFGGEGPIRITEHQWVGRTSLGIPRVNSLATELLWHVEQVMGPIDTVAHVVAGDDDRSILEQNFKAILAALANPRPDAGAGDSGEAQSALDGSDQRFIAAALDFSAAGPDKFRPDWQTYRDLAEAAGRVAALSPAAGREGEI